MTGGELVVRGARGRRAPGARMRRGLLAVGGARRAHHAGAGMIAGTHRRLRRRRRRPPGSGPSAARSWRSAAVTIPSTYRYACTYQPHPPPAHAHAGSGRAYGLPVEERHLIRLLSPLQRRPRRSRQGRDSRMDSSNDGTTADERARHRDRGRAWRSTPPLLRVASHTLASGARVIDAGVETRRRLRRGPGPGGDLHGRARQRRATRRSRSAAEAWPGVTVWTDHPAVACMASQYAGWAISVEQVLRDGLGPAARARPGGAGAVREARLRGGGRRTACWCSRGARCPTDEVAAWVAAEGPAPAVAAHLRRRAHREPRRRRADLRPHPRDRPAQDGDAGLRRAPGGERHGHRADSAGGEERPAGHRPHQRLHPVRRTGALHRPRRRRRAGRAGAPSCRRRRRATTARRSTTSSSATRATSTRSTRCSSARPRSG